MATENFFDTYKTISFVGMPGSGKMTQAKLLSEKTGFKIFSIGDRLREMHTSDTELARHTKLIMDTGGLVPSWLVLYFFHERTLFLPKAEGIIYEGTGRKLHEAQVFSETMRWLERPYRIVSLDIPKEISIARMVNRGKTSHRADDNEASAYTRIGRYFAETIQVVDFYRNEGTLIEVNGNQEESKVFEEMLEKLEARG